MPTTDSATKLISCPPSHDKTQNTGATDLGFDAGPELYILHFLSLKDGSTLISSRPLLKQNVDGTLEEWSCEDLISMGAESQDFLNSLGYERSMKLAPEGSEKKKGLPGQGFIYNRMVSSIEDQAQKFSYDARKRLGHIGLDYEGEHYRDCGDVLYEQLNTENASSNFKCSSHEGLSDKFMDSLRRYTNFGLINIPSRCPNTNGL